MFSKCDVWVLNIVWSIVICLTISTLLCPYDYYNDYSISMFTDSTCADPNSVSINNTCYGCVPGYKYDSIQQRCVVMNSDDNSVTKSVPAVSTVPYTC